MSTWNVVQSAGASFFGSAVTATFGGNAGSGNKIIAVVASNWSTPPTTVRDAALNDLNFYGSVTSTNGSVWLYAMDVPAGDVGIPVAITATWGSGNAQSIVIQEVSGLAAGSAPGQVVDYTPGTLTGTSATTGSPAYTSSLPGEYLVCVYGGHTASLTLTAADGTWTLDPASQSSYSDCTVEYKDSSGGTETGGFGNASTGGWAVLMVGFQVAGEFLPDPWGFIQSAGANSFATSVTATFLNNVAAGNKIIAVVGSSFSTVPTSVQDAALNNWTLLGSKVTATGSVWLYALDVPAGDVGTKPAIKATWSNSNGQSILIQEISGLLAGNTTAMIDGTPGTLSGTTAATGSPAYTSAAANEYLVCAYGDNSGNATVVKQGAAWTLDANSQHTFSDASLEYGNSTGGAETSGFTAASTAGWSVLTVAFKLAPPVTGPQVIPYRGGQAYRRRKARRRQQVFPAPAAVIDSTGSSPAGAGAATAAATQAAVAAAAGAGSVAGVATVISAAAGAGAGSVTAGATQIAGSAPAGAGAVSDVITQAAVAIAAGAGADSAVATQVAPAASAGAGSVTAAGTIVFTGSASSAGAGSASAVATQVTPASAAGAGSAADVATQIAAGSAAGASAAAAKAIQAGGAAAAAAGVVSDVTTQIALATAAGAGSVTASGSVSGSSTASIAGAGSVTVVATQIAPAAAAGAGSVVAKTTQIAGAAAAGAGTAGPVPASQAAIAQAAGAGAVSDVAAQQAIASAAGAGSATAAGSVTGAGATAAAAGAGVVTAAATQAATAAAAGAGSVAGVATQIAKATPAGAGAATAAGAITGTANVAGAGAGSAKAAQAVTATAAGAGALAALAAQLAAASLAGAGAATAAGSVTAPVTYGTARQGVTTIPAAIAGQSGLARAEAGGTALAAARATAGQPALARAEAGQMPLPHAEGGQP